MLAFSACGSLLRCFSAPCSSLCRKLRKSCRFVLVDGASARVVLRNGGAKGGVMVGGLAMPTGRCVSGMRCAGGGTVTPVCGVGIGKRRISVRGNTGHAFALGCRSKKGAVSARMPCVCASANVHFCRPIAVSKGSVRDVRCSIRRSVLDASGKGTRVDFRLVGIGGFFTRSGTS